MKRDIYIGLLLLDIIATVAANEYGYGVIVLRTGLLVGAFLMFKIFPE